ncbi:putative Adenylyl-sulfate kinase [Magnetospirillum sp. SS-4]|nr:putative Adenylyl-sulfate kinase [Magnetospirillum sp. SS-4]
MYPMDDGLVVWITGLSGAGKSTVGHMVWESLRQRGVPAIYLDGDVMREMLGAVHAHSQEERRALAHTYGRMCHALAAQGMTVVCSTISMFHAVRDWNRANNRRYLEIYLRVPVEELVRRDPKGLYARNDGRMIGLDAPFEAPLTPDLVIDNGGDVTAEESSGRILALIQASASS